MARLFGGPPWFVILFPWKNFKEEQQSRYCMTTDCMYYRKSRLCQLQLLASFNVATNYRVVSSIVAALPLIFWTISHSLQHVHLTESWPTPPKPCLLHATLFSTVYQDSGTLCLPSISHPQLPLSKWYIKSVFINKFHDVFNPDDPHSTHTIYCLSLL